MVGRRQRLVTSLYPWTRQEVPVFDVISNIESMVGRHAVVGECRESRPQRASNIVKNFKKYSSIKSRHEPVHLLYAGNLNTLDLRNESRARYTLSELGGECIKNFQYYQGVGQDKKLSESLPTPHDFTDHFEFMVRYREMAAGSSTLETSSALNAYRRPVNYGDNLGTIALVDSVTFGNLGITAERFGSGAYLLEGLDSQGIHWMKLA